MSNSAAEKFRVQFLGVPGAEVLAGAWRTPTITPIVFVPPHGQSLALNSSLYLTKLPLPFNF